MKITAMIDRNAFSLDAGDTLAFAAKKFAEKKIGAAPVVQQGMLMGVFTTSDLASALMKRGLIGPAKEAADPSKAGSLTVGRHLGQRAFWLAEDAEFLDAVSVLARHNAELIPVVEGKGKMVGVLWAEDVRKGMAEIFAAPAKAGGKQDTGAAETASALESGSRTPVDQILRLVEKKGSATASELARQFSLPVSEVEEYAVSLEKHGLLKIEYDLFGKMKLRRKE